jgi:hypothetical protein
MRRSAGRMPTLAETAPRSRYAIPETSHPRSTLQLRNLGFLLSFEV